MVRISNIEFGKVDFTRTNKTTRVPKTAVQQTFTNETRTDYTQITKVSKYANEIDMLKTKFADIDADFYLDEARNNGIKMLVVTDADYQEFGAKWDKF